MTATARRQRGRTLAAGSEPYGRTVTRLLPALRRGFLDVNRYLAVPLLRAGLGPLLANPWSGSLMVLRTRGRRTGMWRDAPLGYLVRDGCVYCCAGFGPSTLWLRNLQADPRVELILPDRSVSGLAEVVTEHGEQVEVTRELFASMRLVSGPLVGDLRRMADADVAALSTALPLVRIRVTGIAPGPWDPGGAGWTIPVGVSALVVAWLARRGIRGALRGMAAALM